MVDTPKYKSNFVRGLEENNNRILTYVTIFFTFAFLGCLLAFWIYEHRGSRCVFGPSCCYTQMRNAGSGYSAAEAVLQQRDSETNWGATTDSPETIQLDASTLSGSGNAYKFYAHLYPGQNTTGGPSYPDIPESNSGFCIGTGGVSLYFDYYTSDNGISWDHAYNLFYYGVNQYITTPNFLANYFADLLPPSNKIIKYVTTPSSLNDGVHLVTSNKASNGFFLNLTPTNNSELDYNSFIAVKKNNQDGKGYNPFMDFKKTRQIVNNTATSGKLFKPICIEPSSKNLPSCRLPRTSQGYPIMDSNNKFTGNYSQNCSHNNFPGPKSSGDQTIEQLIPNESYIGERLSACGGANNAATDPTCQKSGCRSTGCTGGDDGKGSVDLKVGTTDFSKKPGADKFSNAYLSANIFCGQGTPANPQSMYLPTEADTANSQLIRGRVRGSTVPNATKKNGVFTLGFK